MLVAAFIPVLPLLRRHDWRRHLNMRSAAVAGGVLVLLAVVVVSLYPWEGDPDSLNAAVSNGDVGRVSSMLNGGQDPNVLSSYGDAALHIVARAGRTRPDLIAIDLETLDLLLDAGADVNQANHVGSTPLVVAVNTYGTSPKIVARLLDAGANPCVVPSDLLQEVSGANDVLGLAEYRNAEALVDLLRPVMDRC